MTDTDHDIDPTLDTHLRRTLHTVASTVPEPASVDQVVRLVTPPMPSRPRTRWTWLGAATAAGVVAGAALMTVADRDSDITAVPAATTDIQPGPEPDMFGLANGCAAAHDLHEPDEPMTAVAFAPTSSSPNGTVLVSVDDTFLTCDISSSGDAVVTDDNVVGETWGSSPTADTVQVLEVRGESSRYAMVGPGRILVVGRAGAAVRELDLELPDGTTSAGQIVDGWFLAESRVAADVPMLEARLNWHTDSGTASSNRVDLLDDDTDAEACARQDGCVDATLQHLLDEARTAGRTEQATILADGEVTDAERVDSLTAFADCFNSADTGALAIVSGPEGVRIGTANLDDDEARERMRNADALCRAIYTTYVDDAWLLLDARHRLAQQ